METQRVTCVITTYNRKELLMECLDAVLRQTYSVQRIVLIDNASTDGTKDSLLQHGYFDNPRISYVEMKTNTGGAGGFCEGLKRAGDDSSDWVWIMDDDTIPNNDCLENLIRAGSIILADNNDISFLASAVFGPNGESMNLPSIDMKPAPNGYASWYKYLKDGIVAINTATFVSILINKKALIRCGLPNPDFFIWGDDTEYTKRLSSFYGQAYFVGGSVAIHKRKSAKALDITSEQDADRIRLYKYLYRNDAIRKLYYSNKSRLIVLLGPIIYGLRFLKMKNGLSYFTTVLSGTVEGIHNYPRFKQYIDEQLVSGNERTKIQ